MALALLSLSDLALQRMPAKGLPPSDYPLRLSLPVPPRGQWKRWSGIAFSSILIHALLFATAIQLPSLVQRPEPSPRVAEHRTPLYLPPDVMTQKARNRNKVAKQIDLASLTAWQRNRTAQQDSRGPSVKRFELAAQSAPQLIAKIDPKILPDAPNVAPTPAPAPQTPGSTTGLPVAPAPPSVNVSPFETVGTEAPAPPSHPKFAPPKATVQAALNQLAHGTGSQTSVTDEDQKLPRAPSPGTMGQTIAQHSAIELKSDPQGADFKPYLTRILSIVRANWRHVIPQSARLGTIHGRTVVEFIINRDGSIPKVVTAESSGLDPLDQAAVAGLSMSNPLPPLPEDFKGLQIRLAFTFAYNMPSQ